MSWSSASGRKELEARLRQIGGSDDAAIDLAEVGGNLGTGALADWRRPIIREFYR